SNRSPACNPIRSAAPPGVTASMAMPLRLACRTSSTAPSPYRAVLEEAPACNALAASMPAGCVALAWIAVYRQAPSRRLASRVGSDMIRAPGSDSIAPGRRASGLDADKQCFARHPHRRDLGIAGAAVVGGLQRLVEDMQIR